jgi:hypothetical protein
METTSATPNFEQTTDLNRWKKDVLHCVNARIGQYPTPVQLGLHRIFGNIKTSICSRLPSFVCRLLTLLRPSWRFVMSMGKRYRFQRIFHRNLRAPPSPHQVFLIPELLENILQFVDPETQIRTVWNVSRTWRATIQHIVKPTKGHDSFHTAYPCSAVEYGEEVRLSPGMFWFEPTVVELQRFRRELRSFLREDDQKGLYKLWPIYFSPRLVRRQDLRPRPYFPPRDSKKNLLLETPSQLLTCYLYYYHYFTTVPGDTWADFSQFQFNPYLCAMFSSRITLRNGICEIKLAPGLDSDRILFSDTYNRSPLKHSIESMFVTQPPCKSLVIGYSVPYWRVTPGGFDFRIERTKRLFVHIDTMRSEDGVRCGQFLDSLEKSAKRAVREWLRQCEQLKIQVSNMSAVTEDRWGVPGYPTLFVQLGNTPTDYRFSIPVGYCLELPRIKRQLEWMPAELVHPEVCGYYEAFPKPPESEPAH